MIAARVPVLVVEDDALISHFIREELDGTRYDVVGVAATVADAQKKAVAARPSLALIDVKLRGAGDGIALARELIGAGIICVMVTGSVDPETIARIRDIDPAGLLRKPFTADGLIAALDQAVNAP